MASAVGFELVGARGNYMPQSRRYFIPSSDATAVFIGSPVKLAGSADASGRCATVTLCADTAKACGVVVGVDQVEGVADANFSLYRKHRPASIGMYVHVIDDPEALFRISSDDVGGAIAAADIGLNCGYTAESGNTTTGKSTIALDTSDKATTSTLPLRIERFESSPDNVIGGTTPNVIVSFNQHAYKTGYDTGAAAEIGGLGV